MHRRAVTLRPSNNVLQLTTSTGLWLTPPPSVVQLQEEMDKDMQCARFFNNEMTFSDKEVKGGKNVVPFFFFLIFFF